MSLAEVGVLHLVKCSANQLYLLKKRGAPLRLQMGDDEGDVVLGAMRSEEETIIITSPFKLYS